MPLPKMVITDSTLDSTSTTYDTYTVLGIDQRRWWTYYAWHTSTDQGFAIQDISAAADGTITINATKRFSQSTVPAAPSGNKWAWITMNTFGFGAGGEICLATNNWDFMYGRVDDSLNVVWSTPHTINFSAYEYMNGVTLQQPQWLVMSAEWVLLTARAPNAGNGWNAGDFYVGVIDTKAGAISAPQLIMAGTTSIGVRQINDGEAFVWVNGQSSGIQYNLTWSGPAPGSTNTILVKQNNGTGGYSGSVVIWGSNGHDPASTGHTLGYNLSQYTLQSATEATSVDNWGIFGTISPNPHDPPIPWGSGSASGYAPPNRDPGTFANGGTFAYLGYTANGPGGNCDTVTEYKFTNNTAGTITLASSVVYDGTTLGGVNGGGSQASYWDYILEVYGNDGYGNMLYVFGYAGPGGTDPHYWPQYWAGKVTSVASAVWHVGAVGVT